MTTAATATTATRRSVLRAPDGAWGEACMGCLLLSLCSPILQEAAHRRRAGGGHGGPAPAPPPPEIGSQTSGKGADVCLSPFPTGGPDSRSSPPAPARAGPGRSHSGGGRGRAPLPRLPSLGGRRRP